MTCVYCTLLDAIYHLYKYGVCTTEADGLVVRGRLVVVGRIDKV